MQGCATIRQGGLTDSDVERVVQKLRAIDHNSAWARTLDVGKVVFEGLGGGSEEHWRSRRSSKNVSLRRLVEHPACPFKKTALADAVNVHLFVKRNSSAVDFSMLTPTHVMRVVGLPNEDAIRLLRAVTENAWTVRDVVARVRLFRRESGDRRGRPVSSVEQKAETWARRAMAALRAMHEQLAQRNGLDHRYSSALVPILDDVVKLATEARQLAEPDRQSVIRLSLAKAPAPLGDRELRNEEVC
jgi:hypothetical protein